jgi:tellurite resistance protein
MSIELELHFEGPDANDKTLLDFQNWLKREGIAGLKVHRKMGTPNEGDMGIAETILVVILSVQAIIQAGEQIAIHVGTYKQKEKEKAVQELVGQIKNLHEQTTDAFLRWKEMRGLDISAKPEVTGFEGQDEIHKEIKVLLEKLEKLQ